MLTNISIQQEDIILISIFIMSDHQNIKSNLRELKEKIDGSTVIVVDSNTPLKIMDRTARQKISEK